MQQQVTLEHADIVNIAEEETIHIPEPVAGTTSVVKREGRRRKEIKEKHSQQREDHLILGNKQLNHGGQHHHQDHGAQHHQDPGINHQQQEQPRNP